uniref:Uncharacterized protein n=1 Tax=Anopheles atroparvus TaxID=41427 RepID=A0A182IXX9_ANOAO
MEEQQKENGKLIQICAGGTPLQPEKISSPPHSPPSGGKGDAWEWEVDEGTPFFVGCYEGRKEKCKENRSPQIQTRPGLPIEITHLGSGIWSYTLRKAGAILFVSVPATMITSACRGEARNTTPNRSIS